MCFPLEIAFRNLAPFEASEARVRERVARLERRHDRIVTCRVVVRQENGPHARI